MDRTNQTVVSVASGYFQLDSTKNNLTSSTLIWHLVLHFFIFIMLVVFQGYMQVTHIDLQTIIIFEKKPEFSKSQLVVFAIIG